MKSPIRWFQTVAAPEPEVTHLVERTATGYRMLLGGTVVTACMHPNAVTEQRTIPPATRYTRKICGPGRGMVRRVQTRGQEYLVRRCPDCPTQAVTTLGSDIYLPPGMTLHLAEVEGESDPLPEDLFNTPWEKR